MQTFQPTLMLVHSVTHPRYRTTRTRKKGDARARQLRIWLERTQLEAVILECQFPESESQSKRFRQLWLRFLRLHAMACSYCSLLDQYKFGMRRDYALQRIMHLLRLLAQVRGQMQAYVSSTASH